MSITEINTTVILFTLCMLASLCLSTDSATFGQDAAVDVVLRPPSAFAERAHTSDMPVPFQQTVPLAKGQWQPGAREMSLLIVDGRSIPAAIQPVTYWPDGSVRMLRIEGVWPVDMPLAEQMVARVVARTTADERPTSSDGAIVHRVTNVGGRAVAMLDERGGLIAHLTPRIGVMPIDRERPMAGSDPDYLDQKGQYHWAAPLAELSKDPKPIALQPRILDGEIERMNTLYTLYRFRGDGGSDELGAQLEWQLRVRVYHHSPIIRTQATWKIFWDSERYALAEAAWDVDFKASFQEVRTPAMATGYDLGKGEVYFSASPDARCHVQHGDDVVSRLDRPSDALNAWAVRQDDRWLGVSVPRAGWLGPNHLAFHAQGIELATWSDRAGVGLDLRSTLDPDEFMVHKTDLETDARGLSFTTSASLCWGDSAASALAVACAEADRDGWWFPARSELTETGAIDPWSEGVYDTHLDYFEGLRANLHFLYASQRHWRWSGLVNFGDIRTNFAYGNAPDRGLHRLRWALSGRYGWRNGSGDLPYGLFYAGLFLNDRDILLMAMDYAQHVANIDVRQPSFTGLSVGDAGGMHRRNKHHWSGKVQCQYTPTRGLYMARWLTGDERVGDALHAARAYFLDSENQWSVYAGSAWISHYAETRDPEVLATAERLLATTVDIWTDKDSRLSGLASLHVDDFRRTYDVYPVLVEFYQATGDGEYLDAILQSVRAHEQTDRDNPELSDYRGTAYLLAFGFSESQIGTERIAEIRERVASYYPDVIPGSEQWTYEQLVQVVTEQLPPRSSSDYRNSMPIGERAKLAPIVVGYFGRDAAGDE